MIVMMMLSPRNTRTRRIASRVCGLAFALAMLAASEAGAQSAVQGVPNAMQGFSQNRDQPIQIEAATLEMRDKKKEATFSGNVKVVQGDTTMTSKTLVVFYELSGAAPARRTPPRRTPPANAKAAAPAKGAPIPAASPGPGGASSIKRLEARGNVVVTQKDQVVTGETAVFDTKTNLVTMLGGVVLTQGKNVLRGDRLMVDMTTGVSRVESDSGRVQGLFQSSGQGGLWVSRRARRTRRPRRPPQINRNNINHLYDICRGCGLKLAALSLYLRGRPAVGRRSKSRALRWASGHPFLHDLRANRNAVGRSRDHRERLSKAAMVDLLGMFRRRPAKRAAGICALARRHHRARRFPRRHAGEPGTRRAADRSRHAGAASWICRAALRA